MTLTEALFSQSPDVALRNLEMWDADALPPELKAMQGCAHNPLHHPEGDVWEHTLLVVRQAAKLLRRPMEIPAGWDPAERLTADWLAPFMWAALLHDVGKP